VGTANGQAMHTASGHESVSRRRPATRLWHQPAVVAFIA
jgi:hypothetical protein